MRRSLLAALLLVVSGLRLEAAPTEGARLTDALSSRDAAQRLSAVRELAALDETTATPLVRRALEDVDLEVRLAAIVAVGQLQLHALAPLVLDRATSPELRVRETAVAMLSRLALTGEAEARAVDDGLLRALGDPEPSVRAAAVRALVDRPGRAASRPAFVEGIAELLVDVRPELRRGAAEALGRLADPAALHALAARVDDPSPEVRAEVARALAAIGDPRGGPAVLRLADDGAEEVRAAAIATLGALQVATAVPRLTPLLLHPREPLAGPAAVALGRIAAAPRDDDRTLARLRTRAGEALTAALRRSDNRTAVLEGIRAAGPASAELLSRVLPALGPRPADDVLLLCAELTAAGHEPLTARLLELARIAVDGRFDVPLIAARPPAGATRDALVVWLAARLGDPGAAARRAAAEALGAIADPRAATALEALLDDPDLSTRRAALLALARSSTATTPRLVEGAGGADRELGRAAVEALAGRRDDVARRALATAVTSDDPVRARRAAIALAGDAGASVVVPALATAFSTGPVAAREAAALALMGPLRGHADAAVAALCLRRSGGDDPGGAGALELLGAMRDPSTARGLLRVLPGLGRRPLRRARLYAALGDLSIGRDDASVARALNVGLDDPDARVRAAAAWALGKLRDPGPQVLSALSSHLADPSSAVRTDALASLARLGKPPAPPVLARLAQDRDPGVRANALRLGAPIGFASPGRLTERAVQKRGVPPSPGADYLFVQIVDGTKAGSPTFLRVGLPDGLAAALPIDELGLVRDEGAPSGELVLDPDPSLR